MTSENCSLLSRIILNIKCIVQWHHAVRFPALASNNQSNREGGGGGGEQREIEDSEVSLLPFRTLLVDRRGGDAIWQLAQFP